MQAVRGAPSSILPLVLLLRMLRLLLPPYEKWKQQIARICFVLIKLQSRTARVSVCMRMTPGTVGNELYTRNPLLGLSLELTVFAPTGGGERRTSRLHSTLVAILSHSASRVCCKANHTNAERYVVESEHGSIAPVALHLLQVFEQKLVENRPREVLRR